MKKFITLLLLVSFSSCQAQEAPKEFSEKALTDIFISEKGSEILFSKILKKHQGKQIVIDVWASWCKDCIKGMPKVKELQNKNPETVFMFLSLDKSLESWKNGIKKYNVKGEHYFMQTGWKGEFATFLDLDWIPRYLVIGKEGNIKLFKAIKADDSKLQEALKQ